MIFDSGLLFWAALYRAIGCAQKTDTDGLDRLSIHRRPPHEANRYRGHHNTNGISRHLISFSSKASYIGHKQDSKWCSLPHYVSTMGISFVRAGQTGKLENGKMTTESCIIITIIIIIVSILTRPKQCQLSQGPQVARQQWWMVIVTHQ